MTKRVLPENDATGVGVVNARDVQNQTWYNERKIREDHKKEPSKTDSNFALVHLSSSGNEEAQHGRRSRIPTLWQ